MGFIRDKNLIEAMSCIRCGKEAIKEWVIPADGEVRNLCLRCDAAVNHAALTAMQLPNVDELMTAYIQANVNVARTESESIIDYSALSWNELKTVAEERLTAIPRKRVNIEKALVALEN